MWLSLVFLIIFIIIAIIVCIYVCKHHRPRVKDDLDEVDLDIINKSMNKDMGLDDDN